MKLKRFEGFITELMFEACNIYRTESFIVKQKICFSHDSDASIMRTLSDDTYYLRTPERDMAYEEAFASRGRKIDGKRIKTSMYIRTYID